ncbi:Succinyl-diaminopimelate desuccinylase [Candidatus Calditenuaceae archaeon HR02]|nr:Succinyl-diaminopimelate desuccinylase [Candidatus Calditenuaceae archaeon HR02]
MGEAAGRVAEALERVGLRSEVFTDHGGYPVVWGELREERHGTLLIYNHYDVQPPDPLEKWASPPFQPTIRNGRVYARGACDNKGNLAARLCALDLLLDAIGEVPLNIKFLIEGEEEIGSPHLSRLLWLMQQEGGGTIFTCRRGGRGIKLARRRDNHNHRSCGREKWCVRLGKTILVS